MPRDVDRDLLQKAVARLSRKILLQLLLALGEAVVDILAAAWRHILDTARLLGSSDSLLGSGGLSCDEQLWLSP